MAAIIAAGAAWRSRTATTKANDGVTNV